MDILAYIHPSIFERRMGQNQNFQVSACPKKGPKKDPKKERLQTAPDDRRRPDRDPKMDPKMVPKRCLFWVPVFLAALGSLLRPPGPSGCSSRPLPAPSWGCLGAILGHLGATLGLSCASLARLGAHLAPFLPHLGANSGHLGPQVVGLSLPILRRPGSTCSFPGTRAGPSWLHRAFFLGNLFSSLWCPVHGGAAMSRRARFTIEILDKTIESP